MFPISVYYTCIQIHSYMVNSTTLTLSYSLIEIPTMNIKTSVLLLVKICLVLFHFIQHFFLLFVLFLLLISQFMHFVAKKIFFIIQMYKYMYICISVWIYVCAFPVDKDDDDVDFVDILNECWFVFFYFFFFGLYSHVVMSIYIYEMNYEENISFKNFNKNIKIAAIAVKKKKILQKCFSYILFQLKSSNFNRVS